VCYCLEINISFFYSSDSSVLPMSKGTVNVNVRITPTLKKIIEKYIDQDTYINMSDFARDALREKIKRDAPWLIDDMMRKEGSTGS